MQENFITTHYTARYYTLGELTEHPDQEVWLVLHGYGQLARYFIQKFKPLTQENCFIVAPEASSLFYLQGTDGRVGATWMTREFRKIAINNYVTYLQQIYQELNLANRRLVLLGFSQGVSTLVRWAVQQRISFEKIILWAGEFPPDVDAQVCQEVLLDRPSFYVYGNQDEYINAERMAEQQVRFRQFHFEPEIIRFSGKHTIDLDVLRQLQQKKPS